MLLGLAQRDLIRLLNGTQLGPKVTTITTLKAWLDSGLPLEPGGGLDLATVAAWLALQRKTRPIAGADGKEDEMLRLKRELIQSQIDANNAATEYRTIKTELEAFKRQLQTGELLPASRVEAGLLERARWVRDCVQRMTRVAPRMVGLDLVGARKQMVELVRELCADLVSQYEGGEVVKEIGIAAEEPKAKRPRGRPRKPASAKPVQRRRARGARPSPVPPTD